MFHGPAFIDGHSKPVKPEIRRTPVNHLAEVESIQTPCEVYCFSCVSFLGQMFASKHTFATGVFILVLSQLISSNAGNLFMQTF